MAFFSLVILIAALLVTPLTVTAKPQWRTNFDRSDPRTVLEDDSAYIYASIAQSVLQYKIAKEAAELGLDRSDAVNHVCYDDYGCFYKNGTYGNFYRLPWGPADVDTKFQLFTALENHRPEMLDYKNVTSLVTSSFRADRPTVMMIHGFGSGPWGNWVPPMKEAIFRGIGGPVNFIFVDWSKGAAAPDYWAASANTQMAAVQISKLIAGLNTHLGSTSSSFHLIGHSLGAHVAGFTGHRLNVLGHERVGRITALDPAGPVFEDAPHTDGFLSADDADFVAGIHGNAVALIQGGFGMWSRVGHIDFYPNGGEWQPGCAAFLSGIFGSIFQGDWSGVPETAKCHHNRAIEFAIESVNEQCSDAYRSYGCDNYTDFKDAKCLLGAETGAMNLFATNTPQAKKHYLVTKGEEELGFCAHSMKVSLQLSAESETSEGTIDVILVGRDGVEESIEQLVYREDLPAGKRLVEIVASRTRVTDLQAVKIKYEPNDWLGCGWTSWFPCWANQITADWVEIDSLDGHGDHRCGGFEVFYKGHTVEVPLADCVVIVP
ncbi:putative Pancreatic lipase-related protein 2 [Hypsibius exemplaris]|uniref:Pancreatic lipase-related protein 2 n=1 Tax=Hypsibius exemplaris TaxID=2072580 RepID=A0A9X6NGT3_HYPEX|nr:putative Pancreatic lipase-related protein 2 [Hypsibius exemplaris]